MIPTSIDGTDITGATIDGTDVTEITVDGDTVFSAWPGASLVNPVHRYVAANENLADGDPFTSFTDIIAGDDLSAQGTPTYGQSEIGGKPAAVLDASNTEYFEGSFTSTVSQPLTVFAVFQANNGNTRRAIFDDNTSDLHGVQFFFDNNSIVIRDTGGSFDVAGTPTTADTILTVQYNSSSSFIRVNGTESNVNVGSRGMPGVALGYDTGSNRRPFDGVYAEWLIADSAVSSNDIDAEEQRLANFYGISLN